MSVFKLKQESNLQKLKGLKMGCSSSVDTIIFCTEIYLNGKTSLLDAIYCVKHVIVTL